MGVVYEAVDEQLQRTVAIKRIRDLSSDPNSRERLWREARMAASVNHPHICQIYEIGEDGGELFLAIEYLEGEPLGERTKRGVIPFREAMRFSVEILSALGALHRRGIVHRDLKPSNVFLTEHGVKLLDFGLARPRPLSGYEDSLRLTQRGVIVGTPGYLAPEQWSEDAPVGPASDLFALGAILYEMLTGQPAFARRTLPETFRAVMDDQPPDLVGGDEVRSANRIIQRALAKSPEDRYPDAESMSRELTAIMEKTEPGPEPAVLPTRRLIVLPFRMLRPDPEIDFLAFSLPDAITASLSTVDSIIIRSSRAASGAMAENPDLKAIATEAGVDAVLCGTLLRSGEKLQVTSQLIETPSGTVISSRSVLVPLGDLFRLQDDLAREIIESLSLSGVELDTRPLQDDIPKEPEAYEAYLRANHLASNIRLLPDARDLYLTCLNKDPDYAPAWARLGRVYRIMAKYGHEDWERNYRLAEEAFQVALGANPDLSIAHRLYTNLELENGLAEQALGRLLRRAQAHPSEAEMFAALVMTCRFCGLLRASVAADRRAKGLDPGTRTSVSYTYWMMGEFEKAMLHDEDDMRFVTFFSLPLLGRPEEAIRRLQELERSEPPGVLRQIMKMNRASIEKNVGPCLEAVLGLKKSGFHDPEGWFFVARCLARVGEKDAALEELSAVVEGGFCCHEAIERDPWLDPLRETEECRKIMERSRERLATAVSIFVAAGGEELLGVRET